MAAGRLPGCLLAPLCTLMLPHATAQLQPQKHSLPACSLTLDARHCPALIPGLTLPYATAQHRSQALRSCMPLPSTGLKSTHSPLAQHTLPGAPQSHPEAGYSSRILYCRAAAATATGGGKHGGKEGEEDANEMAKKVDTHQNASEFALLCAGMIITLPPHLPRMHSRASGKPRQVAQRLGNAGRESGCHGSDRDGWLTVFAVLPGGPLPPGSPPRLCCLRWGCPGLPPGLGRAPPSARWCAPSCGPWCAPPNAPCGAPRCAPARAPARAPGCAPARALGVPWACARALPPVCTRCAACAWACPEGWLLYRCPEGDMARGRWGSSRGSRRKYVQWRPASASSGGPARPRTAQGEMAVEEWMLPPHVRARPWRTGPSPPGLPPAGPGRAARIRGEKGRVRGRVRERE